MTTLRADEYNKILREHQPPLTDGPRLRMADGSMVNAVGQAEMNLDFGKGIQLQHTVVVSNRMECPAIIGLDF